MDAIAQMGEIFIAGSKLDMMTNAKLVIFCNAVEDNPFMAGGFHGVGEPDIVINVGGSGPRVIKTALEKVKGESMDVVAETIKKTAFKVTRMQLKDWAFNLGSWTFPSHQLLPLVIPLPKF